MENSKNRECNRSIFARMVLPAFITAHIWNSDVRAVYSKFMERISKDINPYTRAQNDERRKILENCLTLFTDIKLKKEVDAERDLLKKEINVAENRTGDYERRPTDNELTKRLLSVFSEKIFGDNKRKYDMSSKYKEGYIQDMKTPDGSTLMCVDVVPVIGTHYSSWSIQDEYGRIISINLIGKLHYLNGFKTWKYLNQYRVSIFKDEKLDDDEYIVYSNINLSQMDSDPRYANAVFREILSKNNIELSNSSGYIGEIVKSEEAPKKLEVEQEWDSEGDFYQYQISPQYALIYNPEHLSVVIDYVKQQELIKQKIAESNSDAR